MAQYFDMLKEVGASSRTHANLQDQGVTAMVRGTLFILAVFTTVVSGELVALEAAANTGGGTGR